MNDFKAMQDTHMAMLARQDANPDDPVLIRDAQAFINEAVVGSTFLSDPGERDLLRAYLRYWAGVIYQQTGAYPKTELRPAESSVGTATPPELVTGPPPAAPAPVVHQPRARLEQGQHLQPEREVGEAAGEARPAGEGLRHPADQR